MIRYDDRIMTKDMRKNPIGSFKKFSFESPVNSFKKFSFESPVISTFIKSSNPSHEEFTELLFSNYLLTLALVIRGHLSIAIHTF